jgi:hypothetical protein
VTVPNNQDIVALLRRLQPTVQAALGGIEPLCLTILNSAAEVLTAEDRTYAEALYKSYLDVVQMMQNWV